MLDRSALLVGQPRRELRRTLVLGVATCAGLVVSVLVAPAALAATDPSFTASVPLQATNWNSTLTVGQFDPARGTLTGITCTLTGGVQGNAKFESLDGSATTVTTDLQAAITLRRPDVSVIQRAFPLVERVDGVTAYDGTTDFGGGSGRTYVGLSGTDSAAFTLSSASDLALFTGTGTLGLPVTAGATSVATGAGNIQSQFATNAQADLTCQYVYTPAPKPGNDSASTSEGAPVVIAVLGNDSGDQANGTQGGTLDPGSVTVTTGPANGTTSVNAATGAVTYTPTGAFTGTDTFTYQVCNNFSLCRTAVVTVTVAAQSDLSLTKSSSAFTAGGTGTYTLVVANSGPSATTGATTVSDTLPTGFTVTGSSSSPAGFTCTTGPGPITCTHAGSLANGASSTITLDVSVASNAGGSRTNTASVSNSNGDPVPGNNTGTVTTTVAVSSDLSVTKAAGPLVTSGAGTYTLVVSNAGPSNSTGTTTVSDTLPAGLTFTNSTGSTAGWSCSAAGQVVTCTSGTAIASGSTSTIKLNVSVSAASGTVLDNTATVSNLNDSTSGNDSGSVSSTVTSSADLAITKVHTGTFVVGSNGSYTVTISNNGPSASSGTITVSDTLPASLTFVSGGGSGFTCSAAGQVVTCTSSASLSPAGPASFPIVVGVGAAAAPSVSNTATVSSANDGTPGNNSSTDTAPVTPRSDLSLTKSTAQLPSGGVGTYTLTVTNNGPNATTGTVTATDLLPAGLTFRASGSGGNGFACSAAGQTVTCTRNTALANGVGAAITLNVDVTAAAGTSITNTASVAHANDVNPANDADSDTTIVTRVNDLSLAKTVGSLSAGQNGTYTLTVSNAGPSPTVGTTTVTDTLPASLTFVSGSGSGFTCAAAGQVITCAGSTAIASGGTAAISLVVAVDPTATGTIANSASVSNPNGSDPTPGNNTGSSSTAVTTPVDAAISLTGPIGATVGQNATYSVSVVNNGPATTGALTVTTTLPAGLTFVSGSGGGFTCSAAGQVVTCTRPTALAPGGTASFPVVVAVGPAAAPSVSVTATVATAGDTVPGNNSATVSSTVTPAVDESVTLTGPSGGFTYGNVPASYQVNVTNNGPSPSGSSTVTLVLAPGEVFGSSMTTSGFACSVTSGTPATGQTVSCTRAPSLPSGASAGFSVTVTVQPGTASPVTATATVATANDTNPANNTASTTTPVSTVSDVSVALTPPGTLLVGPPATYTATVTNNGPSPTAGPVTVTDTLPAGLTFVSGGGGGFTCTAVGQVVTCVHPGPMAFGETDPIALVVQVGPAAYPTVTNTVTVATATPADDPNPSNNTATAVTGVQAGPVPPAGSVSGVVYRDNNNNGSQDGGETGIAGVTIALTGTDSLGNPVSRTTTTLTDGSFAFTGLRPGTYTATETQPAGFLDGKDAGPTASTTTTNDVISGLVVVDGSAVTAVTFGELVPASLGNRIFTDTNANGVQDAGEPGVGGVLVTLAGTDDLGSAVTASTTTAADGSYAFTGLRPGTYAVTVTAPSGTVLTRPDLGGDDSTDSDAASGSGRTPPTALGAGQNNPTLDAGLIATASVAGVVYVDTNRNGVRDAGEQGIAGVPLTLTGADDLGNPVTRTTVTAADGSWAFTGLRPGTYGVSEPLPAGYRNGAVVTPRGMVTTTGDVDSVGGIVLAPGDAVTAVMFGEIGNAKPVAKPDHGVSNGDPVTTDVLGNDSDPDGNPLTVAGFTQPAHGTVVCTSAGACTYTPENGFNGTDAYTYTLGDGHGGTSTTTVTLVTSANADSGNDGSGNGGPGDGGSGSGGDLPLTGAELAKDTAFALGLLLLGTILLLAGRRREEQLTGS